MRGRRARGRLRVHRGRRRRRPAGAAPRRRARRPAPRVIERRGVELVRGRAGHVHRRRLHAGARRRWRAPRATDVRPGHGAAGRARPGHRRAGGSWTSGGAEPDDHNSASIHDDRLRRGHHRVDPAPQGPARPHQRRRTDGSWLGCRPIARRRPRHLQQPPRAPPTPPAPRCSTTSTGASASTRRSWPVRRRGPHLDQPRPRAPRPRSTTPTRRPYVQYSPTRQGRIDLLATESPPGDGADRPSTTATSRRAGPRLGGRGAGPLGSAVSGHRRSPGCGRRAAAARLDAPTSWSTRPRGAPDRRRSPSRISDATTATGGPVGRHRLAARGGRLRRPRALRRRARLHGPHHARSGRPEPGRALHRRRHRSPERRWCPRPTASATGSCGDGQRSPGGTWAWQPLTADSTVDNLRPVLADHPSGCVGPPLDAGHATRPTSTTTSTWWV